ncbi:hypothetical protein V6N13_023028 [Hibiscus sabdariffa]
MSALPIIVKQNPPSVGLFTHQVLDCSPTNRERELGLDHRETESRLEATHAPVARLPTRSRGLWPPRARVVGTARASDKLRVPS